MKASIKTILFSGFLILSLHSIGQVNSLEIDPQKEKMFNPYMAPRHGGIAGLNEFKKTKPHEYMKELWYFSESFYIKKDHFKEGATLDKSLIPVDRYESSRLVADEAIVVLPGFRDVIVLLPANQLIYKP